MADFLTIEMDKLPPAGTLNQNDVVIVSRGTGDNAVAGIAEFGDIRELIETPIIEETQRVNESAIREIRQIKESAVTETEGIRGSVLEEARRIADDSLDAARETIEEFRGQIDLITNTEGLEALSRRVAELNDLYKETDYEELLGMVSEHRLVPGQTYLITDFQTVYRQPMTNTVMYGGTEPLVVTAAGGGVVSPLAFSPSKPSDLILYDARKNAVWNDIADGKGWIYRRVTGNGNDTPYDSRAVMFRRWLNPETGEYTALHPNGGVFKDFYTFSGQGGGNLIDTARNNTILPDNYGLPNSVFLNVTSDNTIGPVFRNNTVLNRFMYNAVGPGFSGNTVARDTDYGGFMNNVIGPDFQDNVVGHAFENNVVGSGCIENTFGDYFQGNTVGNGFGGYGRGNITGKYFLNNRFGDGIKDQDFSRLDGTAQNPLRNNVFGNGIGAYRVWFLPGGTGGGTPLKVFEDAAVTFSAADAGSVAWMYSDAAGGTVTGYF